MIDPNSKASNVAGINTGVVSTIIGCFLFSFGIKKQIGWIVSLPVFLMTIFLTSKQNLYPHIDLSLLSNAIAISILMFFLGRREENLTKKEFVSRILLEDQKNALETALAKSTVLNNELQLEKAENTRLLGELKERSSRDPLTGCFNRSTGLEILTQDLMTAERHGFALSLVFIDLDNLKFVNDTFGHSEGDILISKLAHQMKCIIRKSDYIIRWGGDEFILVLPKCTKAQAHVLLNRARDSIAQTNDSHKNFLSFSFGAADTLENPSIKTQADALVAIADERMYKEKILRKRKSA